MANYFGPSQGVDSGHIVLSCNNPRMHCETESRAEDRAEGGVEEGYADGGQVRLNTFRSGAEKKVDSLYAPSMPHPLSPKSVLTDSVVGGMVGDTVNAIQKRKQALDE